MARLSLIFLLLCIISCNDRSENNFTVLTDDGTNGFEIGLAGTGIAMGGPCTGPTFPTRYAFEDYLILPENSGHITGDRIGLSHNTSNRTGPWVQKGLHGYVNITNNSIEVCLLIPYFGQDGTIQKYTAYRLNGKYTLLMHPI